MSTPPGLARPSASTRPGIPLPALLLVLARQHPHILTRAPYPRARPCASSCLQSSWLTEEGPPGARPAPVAFPTARLRALVREREKRRALLYKKHQLAAR